MDHFTSLDDIAFPEDLFPPDFSRRIRHIVAEANMILGDHSIDELNALAKGADWMINVSHEFRLEHTKKINTDPLVDDLRDTSDTHALFTSMSLVNLNREGRLDTDNWHEYFAVLALMLVKKCIQLATNSETPGSGSRCLVNESGVAALDALEAAMLGAELDRNIRHNDQVGLMLDMLDAKYKEPKKKAAVERHKKTTGLLDGLVSFYDKGGYTTYSSAVQEFLEQTPVDRYEHLAPTNRVRTLTEGLSKIKRGKRKLPEF